MIVLSENNLTRQDLEKKLDAAESHLRYHETEAEHYRLRVAAIQQELGTLPVEQTK